MKLGELIYRFLHDISFALSSDQMIAGYKLSDILKEPTLSDEVEQAIRQQIICYLSRDYARTSIYAFFSYFFVFSNNPAYVPENKFWKKEYEKLWELTDKFIWHFREIQKINDNSTNSYLKLSEPRFFFSTKQTMARSVEPYKSYQSSNYSYSGSDYSPTERHTQYSSNNSSFSNEESPLASSRESVEQTLTSSLSPTAASIDIIRILLGRFYYLRDYHTPDEKISRVVENYARLSNLCERNWRLESDPLSIAIKKLSYVIYLFAKVHQGQQLIKTDPSTLNCKELFYNYTSLIEKLIQYTEALAKLKSAFLPQNLELKDLVVHDQDVIATIHQVTKEKQFLENLTSSASHEHENRHRF